MSADRIVRLLGANVRSTIATASCNYGEDVAGLACRRFIGEAAAHLCETRGKPAAVKALYNAADAIIGDQVFGDVPVGASDEDVARLLGWPVVEDAPESVSPATPDVSPAIRRGWNPIWTWAGWTVLCLVVGAAMGSAWS